MVVGAGRDTSSAGGDAPSAGRETPGRGRAPAAIALTPILSARYRSRDLERIRAAAPGARIVVVTSDGHPDGPLDEVEVLLRGAIPVEVFERIVARAPRLRWVHSATAGVERVLTPLSLERDLVITNARGVFSRPIAEYVMLMILAVSRRLPQLLELQRERTWQPLEGTELRDVTVGIVGLGSIGRAVARLASAFGCRVLAVRRRVDAGTEPAPRPAPGGEGVAIGAAGARPEAAATGWEAGEPERLAVERVVGPSALLELLGESDFIVLAAPLTRETEAMIDAQALARVKPGAWLINVARGRLVDERALLRALREGPLGGAVLDTFWEEPLPPTSPFYDLPNVIVTPHTSWASSRVLDRSIELFCENLRRFSRGEPLLNVVDPTVGY